MNINVNNIDGNILILTLIYRDINNLWIQEINSKGDSFDYDAQDKYQHILKQIFLNSELVEKINPEIEKEERKILLEDLTKVINKNIELYVEYVSLFKDLPRHKILLKTFRERRYSKIVIDDNSLINIFIKIKESQPRTTYFDSELYKEIGFLEHNFHEEIYHFAINTKNQINKNFEVPNNYDPNYLNIHNEIFFNMGIVYHIYSNYNKIVFDEITELEFYKTLNLQNTISYLKPKDIQKFLYIIFKLNKLLEENTREKWLIGILKEIKISREYYQSKYKAVTWKDSTAPQKKFAMDIDTLFKDKIFHLTS